ncbi:50S ribosomal protein L35 [Meiothermus luteus]|uniref:Large ribosomal subunit protein bL35 n=1 Tax=Meiothermus luteus TaxID=2026184 RepID=A0A399EKN5_9DEIN|nr:50S ribosomal protein L35 [Meiothermus luteus]RIH84548.1 50S ribosomal protein L35 [Meiothermus luteus]RMH56109.1 MAG: 50S ribosomal protein L35 [Deinococcota bacterium]
MSKMKTHKGAKNRVKITATGKVIGRKPGKRHLNWQKSGKSGRTKGRPFTFAKGEERRVHRLMPYDA